MRCELATETLKNGVCLTLVKLVVFGVARPLYLVSLHNLVV